MSFLRKPHHCRVSPSSIIYRREWKIHHLVRNLDNEERKAKRRDEKVETKEARGRLDDKDKMIESLLMKIQDFEEKIADHEKYNELLGKLYDSDLINENGVSVII